ncbi:MAG: hypothetical protein NXI31_16730 [bacterium]|nr:hypothetical protein [bacterium]
MADPDASPAASAAQTEKQASDQPDLALADVVPSDGNPTSLAFDPVVGQGSVDAERLATSIAHEIADLASAVEGTAFDLVAAAPERARVPAAAQHFLAAVQRLRTLHAKLNAFGDGTPQVDGSSTLATVLTSLNEELQHLCLGLELEAELPESLPPIAMAPALMRNALLFVCSAMFRAEPGATHLVVSAERGLVDIESRVRIELVLDWIDSARTLDRSKAPESAMALALAAARRLLAAHGGDLRLEKLPGRAIRALIRIPSASSSSNATSGARAAVGQTAKPVTTAPEQRTAAALGTTADGPVTPAAPGRDDSSATPLPDQDQRASGSKPAARQPTDPSWRVPQTDAAGVESDGQRHAFGGTIVVEADPGVRAMVARELRATGRPVFVCSDGSSVRTFLEATPTRFELLIVDQQHRLDDGDALGDAITRLAPHLKICILGPAIESAGQGGLDRRWRHVHRLEKPFGVHELRQALASVLGA